MKKLPVTSTQKNHEPDTSSGTKKGQGRPGDSQRTGLAPDWEVVFRAIGSPAFILAPDYSILAANDATCTLTGKTERELHGRKCWEVFYEKGATRPPEGCPMERVLSSQKHETAEMEVSLNGRFYQGSCTPIVDAEGVIRSIIHIATDITEKKKAERMMQESRDQFRLLFEQSLVPYQSLDADGRFLVVNDAWLSTLGYDRDEVIGHWFGDFITPAFSGQFRANFPKFMASGETHAEFGMKRKDGSVITVAFDGRIGHYPDNSFRQTHCVFRDITREKAAEEAIRESEEKYRLIADNTADNIWIIDMDLQMNYVSPSVKNMKGFSADEIMEMSLDQQMTPESLAGVMKRFNEEMELEATGTADPHRKVLFETEEYCKDGSTILVENSVNLLRDASGHPYAILGISRDITDRRTAENALRESERRYRELVENLNDVIFTVDTNGLITFVSPVGERLFGYSPPDLLEKPFTDIVYGEDVAALLKRFKEIGQGILVPLEWRLVHKDGSHSWVRTSTRPVADVGGNSGFLGVISDISREKEAEQRLLESENKFATIFRSSPVTLTLVSATDGKIVDVNDAFVTHTGYSRDEVIGNTAEQLGLFPDPDERMRMLSTLRERKSITGMDLKCRIHSGAVLNCLVSSGFVLMGNKPYIISTIENITDRKQAEEALRESEAKYRLLADTSPEMIFLIDTGGYVQYVNPVAAQQFYAPPEELEGKHLAAIYPPETAQHHLDAIRNVIADRRMTRHEEVEEFPTGKVYIDVRLAPIINSRNEVTGVLGLSHDITGRKRAEEQRELLLHELGQKNAELDRFTYTVSHDLKGPLISIRGFLSLLEDDLKSGSDERVQTDILRISESAEKLESLITTLLALSRSGKSVDTPVRIPLVDLAKEAARLLGSTLQQRGVTLIISESMPVVNGDRQRLLQVMMNLIDNAVKFMGTRKDPRIEIGVKGDAGTPVFFVQDNGMGIKKENLTKVFGLYERFNPDVPGTGIGLSTVKRIIEAHGGKIWAESEGEGMGTTFWFTLPGAVEGKPS